MEKAHLVSLSQGTILFSYALLMEVCRDNSLFLSLLVNFNHSKCLAAFLLKHFFKEILSKFMKNYSICVSHFLLVNFIGGPAENAGLKPGDCILEINGIKVR